MRIANLDELLRQRIAAVGSEQLVCVSDDTGIPRARQLLAFCQSQSIGGELVNAATLLTHAGASASGPPHSAWVFLPTQCAGDELQRNTLLGMAQRCFAHHLLVELNEPMGASKMPASAFFSFGFRELIEQKSDDRVTRIYEYRLKEYKAAPDWLNARFWANPERFDLQD